MATTLSPPKRRRRARDIGPGQNNRGPWDDDFGGGNDGEDGSIARARTCRTGMWMAMAAITMLFAAFTSSLVVRKGMSSDWRQLQLPGVLWLNTIVLLASSLTLEHARKAFSERGQGGAFARSWFVTTGLGLVFLAGQWVAWRELAARGIYLASNPSSSFFYLLTATHGLHLLGGICALLYVSYRAARHFVSPTVVDVTAMYWHFMDGLWLYLFLLLSAERWW